MIKRIKTGSPAKGLTAYSALVAVRLQRFGALAGEAKTERVEQGALFLIGLNEARVAAAFDVIDQIGQPTQRG